ncbi:hypothetical protein [Jatrophihabitans sp.]|uniref:hypothetical protein n=1 Tax=Jatrophihabitans sp. TaxID=1932789 RepID=UPI002BB732EA|nr:hypothetical protein [Jatrophihabitans sp.]
MDATPLRDAYRTLLDAAATVAEAGEANTVPPAGEWGADQILAHVALVTATAISAVSAVAAGANTTYDNRIALDTWTIERVISLTAGSAELRDRIRIQGEALCALCGSISEVEFDTPAPTRLLSNDAVVVDQVVPLRGILTALAELELPGHTQQLLALLAAGAPATT